MTETGETIATSFLSLQLDNFGIVCKEDSLIGDVITALLDFNGEFSFEGELVATCCEERE